MVRLSGDSASIQIASELSDLAYEQYAEGQDTRLAKATRDYVGALQIAALDFCETHTGLIPPDFMLVHHDNLSNDLYDV